VDNTAELARMALGTETEADLLTNDELMFLMNHLDNIFDSTDGKQRSSNFCCCFRGGGQVSNGDLEESGGGCGGNKVGDKFNSKAIRVGALERASSGLSACLIVDPVTRAKIDTNPQKAMLDEIQETNDAELIELHDYIVNKRAFVKVYPNGKRDEGREGWVLQDFMNKSEMLGADLEPHHVIALRLCMFELYYFFVAENHSH
jgi:hypothetical protein